MPPATKYDPLFPDWEKLTYVTLRPCCWSSWDAEPLLPQKHKGKDWKRVKMVDLVTPEWIKKKKYITGSVGKAAVAVFRAPLIHPALSTEKFWLWTSCSWEKVWKKLNGIILKPLDCGQTSWAQIGQKWWIITAEITFSQQCSNFYFFLLT